MWEGAVDVLVGNSVSLMHSIEELIKDAQVAAVESRARKKDGECRSIGRRVTSIGSWGQVWAAGKMPKSN